MTYILSSVMVTLASGAKISILVSVVDSTATKYSFLSTDTSVRVLRVTVSVKLPGMKTTGTSVSSV